MASSAEVSIVLNEKEKYPDAREKTDKEEKRKRFLR